jgi:hypothetical protein
VVQAQGVIERVHLVVVEHADPVVQLGDVDAERLLEEYAAFAAFDLGFWPGEAGPGRAEVEIGAMVTTEPMKFVAVTTTA